MVCVLRVIVCVIEEKKHPPTHPHTHSARDADEEYEDVDEEASDEEEGDDDDEYRVGGRDEDVEEEGEDEEQEDDDEEKVLHWWWGLQKVLFIVYAVRTRQSVFLCNTLVQHNPPDVHTSNAHPLTPTTGTQPKCKPQ